MNKENSGRSILAGVIIALCSGCFGFGISQATIGAEVKVHSVAISEMKSEFSMEKSRAEKRMEIVSNLISKMLDQNQEFINLLKLQNELMQRKMP